MHEREPNTAVLKTGKHCNDSGAFVIFLDRIGAEGDGSRFMYNPACYQQTRKESDTERTITTNIRDLQA